MALPQVAAFLRETHQINRLLAGQWFPEDPARNESLPEPLEHETISLDGHDLHPIEVGQGDIPHSSVLHIPSLAAVIAGDVVYNGVHQMLGVSGPDEWPLWIQSVERVAALDPRVVVAGHKRPDAPDDDIPEILFGTQAYIAAFIEELDEAEDAPALVLRMTERFPDRINLPTLDFSAAAAIERRTSLDDSRT